MDWFDAEAGQPFHVTSYQLAQAIHAFYPCAFNHNEQSRKYVPTRRCPRLVRLVAEARSVLERASAQPVVPGLPTETPVAEGHKRGPSLPPGYAQEGLFEMLALRGCDASQA